MAHIVESSGYLVLSNTSGDTTAIKDVGGIWDSSNYQWIIAFTMWNLNQLRKNLTDITYGEGFEEAEKAQIEKESKLDHIRKISKSDSPVNLKVPNLKLNLRNYQKLGVMFATTNGCGALIADEMGLGKTVQALATAIFRKHTEGIDSCLIITPASLKYNWPLEIEKFTHEKCVVIGGTPDQRAAQWLRDDVFFYVVNFELITQDLFGGVDLKPKRGETAKQRVARETRTAKNQRRARILGPVRTKDWGMIAIDEVHMLKNPRSKRTKNIKRLHSEFKVGLSGTPLDGKLEELNSVMSIIRPGLLESYGRFVQRYAITDFWGNIKSYKNIKEVNERISPYFIRRLKSDVLKDLPPKIYENRIVELSPEERKIYKAIAKGGHSATEDQEAIVAAIRCKQFCDFPGLVDSNCKSHSKLDALREILEEVIQQNGHKVILFSFYKMMLDAIEGELLEDMGLKYMRIDGDVPTSERADMQKEFNENPNIDIIIGTESMSTGLNFTGANYVINYDDNWQPAIMAQREDRAHRIGQKSTVTVVNFICKDTIEERIRDVLYDKRDISSQALGDDFDEMILKRLGPKDVAKLL